MSLVLLLTIALGVGSNAAVYGFIEGLTQPASPIRNTDRIVSIFQQDRFREAGALSLREYQQLKESRGVFEWIGEARIQPTETLIDGHSEVATVAELSPDLARGLALPLEKGAVISHRTWKRILDGGGNAIGSQVRINNLDFRVVGVAPEQLDGLYSDQNVDIWILSKGQKPNAGSDRRDVWALGRLRLGLSLVDAQTVLGSSSASLRALSVRPFTGTAPNTARGLARVGWFLDFSAAAVFLIACINVVSLLLGRAFKRSRETSLRIALGATRADLLGELLADSIVISAAGGAIGLLLGVLMAHALPVFLFEHDAERLSFTPRLLPILTASLVCVIATALCGMMPVLGTVTDRPWMVLQRECGSPSKAMLGLRSALVVGQIAISCMLVLCTALLLNSLHSALKMSTGHRRGDQILMTVRPPLREGDIDYFSKVEQSAKSVAGLSSLAWMAGLPGNQPTWRTFRVQLPSQRYRDTVMDIAWLTPDSFQMLEDAPVAGRMFGLRDPGRRVAIVNDAAATALFGKKTVGMVIRDSDDLPIEIIGVVKRKPSAKPQNRPSIYYGYLDRAEATNATRPAHFHIPLAPSGPDIELSANIVSANYFNALDMPVIAGRTFCGDRNCEGQRAAIVNQEAADLYFQGKPLDAGVIDEVGVRTQVIGVVRSQVFGAFEQHAEPAIYFPMSQNPLPRMTLIFRAPHWNNAIGGDLRRKVESVSNQGPPFITVTTLEKQLAQSGLAPLRIATLIGGLSAAIAVMLSMLGLISAQRDAECQLQPERALRIALGSQRWRIVLMVVTNAGRLAIVGTVIGTSLSFALLRLVIAKVTGLASPPLALWLIAPLSSAVVVTLASVFPAWRASVISPLATIRDR